MKLWTVRDFKTGKTLGTVTGTKAQAAAVARKIATAKGCKLTIEAGRQNPGTEQPIYDGQIWRHIQTLARVKVINSDDRIVVFTDMSTGQRDRETPKEFRWTHTLLTGRKTNPRRRNPYRMGPAPGRESRVGHRVQLHAATSEWMQGDRYGVIVGYGRARDYRNHTTGEITKARPVKVKLDKSGRIRAFHPENLFEIESNPGGPRIVYNRLLGGWYVVTGPHQTPLNGRFNSKAEAQAWLSGGPSRRGQNPRGGRRFDVGESVIYRGPAWWYEREGSRNVLIGANEQRYNEPANVVRVGVLGRYLMRSANDGRLAWADSSRLELPLANPRGVSEDERALLTHVSRFGSDGYPISKLGRGWSWGYRGIKGPPKVFKTKREAVASFEAFMDILRTASGELAYERAWADRDRAEGRQPNPKERYCLACGEPEWFKGQHHDERMMHEGRFSGRKANPKGHKPAQVGEFNGAGGNVRILNAGGKVWVDFDRGPQGHPDDSGLMQVDSLTAAQAFARVWVAGGGLGSALNAAGGRHRPNPKGRIGRRLSKAQALTIARNTFGPDALVDKRGQRFAVYAGRTSVQGVWNILGVGRSWDEALEDANRPAGMPHQIMHNPRGGKIAVGDRVQYRAEFLRSTGMYTGDVPRAKGIVTALTPFGGAGNALATIEWDIPGIPERVLTPNLKRVGDYEPNPRELSRVRQHGTRVTATGTPAARMAALRQIVAESQYAKIDGTMVDLYTASAIVQIYDALNDANRAKFASFPVGMMAKVAFKLMQPKTNPRAPLNWAAKELQAARMSTAELLGAMRDISKTLPHADAQDRAEGGGSIGGYYRDESSVYRAELDRRRAGSPHGRARMVIKNPSYRLTGTVEEIPDAPPVARRGPGRPRKVRVAPVELAPPLDAVPFEVPAEAPGRELQAGDRVTVPYSGRASYFGRAATKTRESGIFEGYTYENDQRLAFVRINRGHTVETHAFPVDQVRLHGKSFAEQAAGRRAGRPAKLARLTWKAHGSLAKAEAMLEKATAEHAATEAVAMELYPQHEAQPGRPRGRTEAASRDYLNARAKLRRLTERVELLGSVVRSLGGGETVALGYGEATGTDPWAANRRRRFSNPLRHNGPLKNARTVRGASDKRNPRGSERERAVRTFKLWHEFAPHRVTRMKGPDRLIPRTLVKLGDIRSIDYISDKYERRPVTYTHKTDRPRPVLATDPDGQNLHIIGGRVKITGDGLIH